MSEDKRDKYYMESLDKAMRVAELLMDSESGSVKIMDIAEKVGIPWNNAFRILQNFERRRWAIRINGCYRLGGKLRDFGGSREVAWREQMKRMIEETEKFLKSGG